MAIHALELKKNTLHHSWEAGGTITARLPVKLGSDDDTIVQAAADDPLAIGVAAHAGVSGDLIQVELYGHQVLKHTVGTGGVTRGKRVRSVSDGVTDVAAAGGGTTAHSVIGQALQSGVVGDVIGVMIGGTHSQVSAT
ncbi:MAG: hypothetical protein ACTHU0_21995 [Kofleriaceae bacterium]